MMIKKINCDTQIVKQKNKMELLAKLIGGLWFVQKT